MKTILTLFAFTAIAAAQTHGTIMISIPRIDPGRCVIKKVRADDRGREAVLIGVDPLPPEGLLVLYLHGGGVLEVDVCNESDRVVRPSNPTLVLNWKLVDLKEEK